MLKNTFHPLSHWLHLGAEVDPEVNQHGPETAQAIGDEHGHDVRAGPDPGPPTLHGGHAKGAERSDPRSCEEPIEQTGRSEDRRGADVQGTGHSNLRVVRTQYIGIGQLTRTEIYPACQNCRQLGVAS